MNSCCSKLKWYTVCVNFFKVASNYHLLTALGLCCFKSCIISHSSNSLSLMHSSQISSFSLQDAEPWSSAAPTKTSRGRYSGTFKGRLDVWQAGVALSRWAVEPIPWREPVLVLESFLKLIGKESICFSLVSKRDQMLCISILS